MIYQHNIKEPNMKCNEEYFVVKKNMQGIYLLDDRNDVLLKTDNMDDALAMFNKCISNRKGDKETYTVFSRAVPVKDRFLYLLGEK